MLNLYKITSDVGDLVFQIFPPTIRINSLLYATKFVEFLVVNETLVQYILL